MTDVKSVVMLANALIIGLCIFGYIDQVVGGGSLEQPPEIYSLHITSDVKYRFATTLVTSRVKNPYAKSREAVFDVTLPNEAFITNFTLEIDGETVVGEIKEKETAKRQYDAARARGETAGHIGTQHRNTNKFKLAVTVAAVSKVSFNLTYQELLRRSHGLYEQAIYIDPGQPVPDMHVTVAILESREITELIVPPLSNDIDVDITASESIAIVEQPSPTTAYIKYIPNIEHQTAVSSSGIAGKFVVKYDVERDMDGGDLLLVNGYFVHFFAPAGFSPIPKDVLFVLDTSGSMVGRKINQLREAMVSILDQMRDGDRINIMTFSGSTSFWKTEMVTVGTEGVMNKAKRHVGSLSASGWTNINLALTSGLDFLASLNNQDGAVRSPLLVFLTDGEATNGVRDTPTILRNVQRANEGEVPIFSLAFGRHADYDIVKKVAIQNNGIGRKIFDASDAALQIANFYEEISVTLLNNVTFKYLDAPVANVTQHKFNNYFNGSEVVVCGRIADLTVHDDAGIRLEVQSNSVDGPNMMIVSSAPIQGAFDHMSNMTGMGDYEKITEKVWAYLTIKQLLDKELASSDAEEKSAYNRQVLELSLKYGFVTPLTSMVVTQNKEPTTGEVDLTDDVTEDVVVMPRRPGNHRKGMTAFDDPGTPSYVQHSRHGKMMPSLNARGSARLYDSTRQIQPPAGRPPAGRDPQSVPMRTGISHFPPDPPSFPDPAAAADRDLSVDGGTGPRRSKLSRKGRKHRKNKKVKRKFLATSLRVNMTSLENPVCFNLFDDGMPDSATYSLYSNPSHGISVLAKLRQSTRRRAKYGTIDSLDIRTHNTTTSMTRDAFSHYGQANYTAGTNVSWGNASVVDVPGEISVQPYQDYMKVDLGILGMYVSRSGVHGSLVVYVYNYDDVTSDVTGILGEILSRDVKLTKMKKLGMRKKQIGVMKIRGIPDKFPGVLRRLSPQGPAQPMDTCWVFRQNEERFYTMSKYRI